MQSEYGCECGRECESECERGCGCWCIQISWRGEKPEIYENAKAFLRFTPGKLVQPEAAVAAVAVALPILI